MFKCLSRTGSVGERSTSDCISLSQISEASSSSNSTVNDPEQGLRHVRVSAKVGSGLNTPEPPTSSHPSESTSPNLLCNRFSKNSKVIIVIIVSAASMISGLSTHIYFPAQEEISHSLRLSRSTVDLSITTYIMFQGVSSVFWGPLTDLLGRRQVLMYTIGVCMASNLALAFVRNGAMLITFRAFQSIGSASTISLGCSVISDITASRELGGYLGQFTGTRQFALAAGPVIGGLLAEYLGFRAIFWFLFVFSSICLLVVALLLPETLQTAEDWSQKRTSFIYRPLLAAWIAPKDVTTELHDDSLKSFEDELPHRAHFNLRLFYEPFSLLAEPDAACAFLFGSCIFTAWSMMLSSTSYFLKDVYHFSTIEIGICFLANGFGSVLGSVVSGKELNTRFNYEARLWQHSLYLSPTTPLPIVLPRNFPIEKARLSDTPIYCTATMLAFLFFGWSLTPLSKSTTPCNAHWITPLMAQFVVGYSGTVILNSNQALVMDLFPGKSGRANSILNLCRFVLAAVGVALIDHIMEAMNPGWFATVLVGVILLGLIPYSLVRIYGMQWRQRRRSREQAQAFNQTAASIVV